MKICDKSKTNISEYDKTTNQEKEPEKMHAHFVHKNLKSKPESIVYTQRLYKEKKEGGKE